MKVKLLFFASCRDIVGVKETDFELEASATLGDLKYSLRSTYPQLATREKTLSFAVNAEYADDSVKLSEGDEIALIPPVSGG